jgi:hypothetical protein
MYEKVKKEAQGEKSTDSPKQPNPKKHQRDKQIRLAYLAGI